MLRFGMLVVLGLVLWVPTGQAHFVLMEPASYSEQDAFGDPQKAPPCGQGSGNQGSARTGIVTTYAEGETIDITIDERIPHPGHYRVAIATDEASLPAPAPVKAGATPCGSTTIEAEPALPILADGLLLHDTIMFGPQTVQVKLPEGLTCDNCVLQVIEFMSDHGLNVPGGCYYSHCATVSIVAAGTPDAGPGDVGAEDVGSPDAGAEEVAGPDAGAEVVADSDVAAEETDAGPTAPEATADAASDGAGAETPATTGGDGGCAQANPGSGGGALLFFALACLLALRARRRALA